MEWGSYNNSWFSLGRGGKREGKEETGFSVHLHHDIMLSICGLLSFMINVKKIWDTYNLYKYFNFRIYEFYMQYLLGCTPYTGNVVKGMVWNAKSGQELIYHRFLLSSVNGPQYNLRIFPSLTRYWYLCLSCAALWYNHILQAAKSVHLLFISLCFII